jgi:uncharacterized protein (UPF0276 family)
MLGAAMHDDARKPFAERVAALPRLGLGVSTEFGPRGGGLDVVALRRERPAAAGFLEIGVDLERGVDAEARAWVGAGWPTTYHFLDANLEESEDLTQEWIDATAALARELGAAWLCGDAGLWHVGPRDRGHGALLPPILTSASASEMAENVRRLREASGFEVLPENPPAHLYLGDLGLLEYFARVAEDADAGLLLDVAHLAIHQRAMGRAPLDGLDDFPLERVVEVHVAGGVEFAHGGRRFVDDDHSPEPLPDAWAILDFVLPRAQNLRALVYECERNPREAVLANFERLAAALSPAPRRRAIGAGRRARPSEADERPADHRGLQRALFRMQHDPDFAARLRAGDGEALASTRLGARELGWLRGADPDAVAADREGKRAAQLLRNVGSEFPLATRVAPRGDGDPRWIGAFTRSADFHCAVSESASLPLAFAAWLEARAREAPSPLFRALASLEIAMARARRGPAGPGRVPARGEIVLAATALVFSAPAGTHRAAAALARGAAPAALAVDEAEREAILIAADASADARFGRLRPISVEPLAPLVAAFLERARVPQGGAARARFAAEHGVALADLESVVDGYVADGVLRRGA